MGIENNLVLVQFLSKHFPKNHKMQKTFNKNTVKEVIAA